MIIQHNIMALNSHNRLGANNTQVGKNLEKLSSGYKINRAGDDAAGLAISEKMRAQITGLSRAQQNAQDGISLVQTAEGNLTEVHSMLNRMVDLATQSSNGTYDGDNGVDRTNLQEEISALKNEIDRIAETSNFNGIKLLDGSLAGAAKVTTTAGIAAVTGAAATKASFKVSLTDALQNGITTATAFKIGGTTVVTGAAAGAQGDTSTKALALAEINTALGTNDEFTIDGTVYKATLAGDVLSFEAKTAGAATPVAATVAGAFVGATVAATAVTDVQAGTAAGANTPAKGAITSLDFTGKTGADAIGTTLEMGGKKFQFVETGAKAQDGFTAIEIGAADNAAAIATAAATKITAGGVTDITVAANGDKLDVTDTKAPGTASKAPVVKQGGGLSLQIGDTSEAAQRIKVSVADMSVDGLAINNVDISTESGATAAIDVLKDAINTVSTERAKLGATQNRLEHTINNLSTTTENMTAAESRIRDTDMAKEMMQFTKNNVLAQAAQAMLAQANQQPQQVLQLLR